MIKKLYASLMIFFITWCSLGTSGNSSVKINIEPITIDSLSEINNLIWEAYSWVIFQDNPDEKIPWIILDFIKNNTGSNIIGKVPYFDAYKKIVNEEYFLSCDNKYCASYYGNMRIRKNASPTLRLAKILGTTKNQYFHWQYAMRLSDGRVNSLDPLDTNITNTWSLFKRMAIFDSQDITDLTKLVHNRYFLSGWLTLFWAFKFDTWSGKVRFFTGVLEKSLDTTHIPTEITWRFMDPNKPYTDVSNLQVCYDSYEVQQMYPNSTKHHGIINHNCWQDEWSNNNETAMYIHLAQIYGTATFDNILSRTTGVIFSESPWRMPCTTLECPEDNEFVIWAITK